MKPEKLTKEEIFLILKGAGVIKATFLGVAFAFGVIVLAAWGQAKHDWPQKFSKSEIRQLCREEIRLVLDGGNR